MPNKKFKKIKIYLSGRIPIGDELGVDSRWREKYIIQLKKLIPNSIFLDPSFRDIDERDSMAVFGHDLFLIKQADLVIVNAEFAVGLGTAQEMIIAKYFQKPIVSISPRGSYYSPSKTKINSRKISGWRHPFLNILSDRVIEDIKEFKTILGRKLKNKKILPWESFIKKAIEYYLKQYFQKDKKTQEMLSA
jgi:hypothetical protein